MALLRDGHFHQKKEAAEDDEQVLYEEVSAVGFPGRTLPSKSLPGKSDLLLLSAMISGPRDHPRKKLPPEQELAV